MQRCTLLSALCAATAGRLRAGTADRRSASPRADFRQSSTLDERVKLPRKWSSPLLRRADLIAKTNRRANPVDATTERSRAPQYAVNCANRRTIDWRQFRTVDPRSAGAASGCYAATPLTLLQAQGLGDHQTPSP